tara:strand:- start:43039 stop:43848 length:810 start_codon:yes stop_codon:yes gene_type:complete
MEEQQIKGFLDTPALWEGELFGVDQFQLPNIDLTGFVAQPIPQNIRLGHQVEHLYYQVLHHHKRYQVLLFNQPIKSESRTIGEIDFIVQDTETNKLIHIELTYKFYIIDLSIPEKINQLIGPNKRDSFAQKIEKIKYQQFTLLQTNEAIQTLEDLHIDTTDISSRTCFKAQLYAPYTSNKIDILPFNNNCIYGYWLGFHDFDTIEFHHHLYYLPTKKEWIIRPHENVTWHTHQEISIEIKKRHMQLNSPMVWMKKYNQSFEKFFIIFWA